MGHAMLHPTHLPPLIVVKVGVELFASGISIQGYRPPIRALSTQSVRPRPQCRMKDIRLRLARLSLLIAIPRIKVRESTRPRITRESTLIRASLIVQPSPVHPSIQA